MTFYESLEAAAAQNPNINDVRVQYGAETISLRSQFGLWLNKGSPTIGKPETESNLVYVPGSDKVLNLTRALDGKVHYKQRIISAEFTLLRPKSQWETIRHELDTILQGQWLRFYFTRDGELWDGLFDIEVKPGDYKATASLKVTCDPYRKGLVDASATAILGKAVLGAAMLGNSVPESTLSEQGVSMQSAGYARQNFQNGSILFAGQLNHIEDGILNLEQKLGTSGGISDGYASIFEATGSGNNEKLFNAINSGGRYAGSNKTMTLTYKDCDPPGDGKASCQWYLLYRHNYPEMNDNVDTVIKDVVFEPEGENPVLMQLMFGVNGSLTFENCVFRNVLFYFGRAGKYTFTFKNCIIEDNQYQFIQCSDWHNGAEYHIEGCTFRHMRPRLEEYRNDIHSKYLMGWAYGFIRCLAYNVKWFISDTIFEDNMGALVMMFKKSAQLKDKAPDPTKLELYMERCIVRKTNGAGISFDGQPATGWIKDCKFYDIGANRCNGEGYDLPTDEKIVSGTGTEDDPYVYNCGVGSNGIFSYNGRCRHELVITGNYIHNVMENGIEGDFREVSYNHIENTGYRMDEGMYNPSTEGLYGTFAICKGNVIRNPTRHEQGIVITGTYQDGQTLIYEDNVIEFEKDGETNDSTGILLIVEQEAFTSPLIIRNNIIRGFRKKYDIYNKLGVSLENVHIEDIGEQDNVLSGADYYQKNLLGISFGSDKEESIVRDPKFAELDEKGQPTEWHVFYGEGAVYKTQNERFIRIQGTSTKSCACLAQDYHLGSAVYIARIRCMVRSSSGKIGFAPLSLKDDGSVTNGYENFSFNPKMSAFDLLSTGLDNEWREVTHSMALTHNCRVNILNPGFDDAEGLTYRSTLDVKDIDIRITRVQTYSDTEGTIEKAGALFDFKDVGSSYLPANAMSVEYWIPGKTWSYTGGWMDAMWMMGKNTGGNLGRGRVRINKDFKQYTSLVAWYKADFDLELNGHTLECAGADEFAFLTLCNQTKVRVVGPGTIKAKNYAVSISSGCELTVIGDVSFETTGKSYAVMVSKGSPEQRTVLNIQGGSYGPILALAYTAVNFKMADGATANLAKMIATGTVTVDKDTLVVNDGNEIKTIKELTSLVACKNVVARHQAGHGTETLAMTGDESITTCSWTDEKGEPQKMECSLTEAFNKARSTKDTRQGTLTIALGGDIYTYTGFYFRDSGPVELNLNGYAIKNDHQNYALYFAEGSKVTLCDTPDRIGVTGSVESTTYSTIIVNGAQTRLNINGGIIRQTTGIAVNVMDGAAVTLSGEGAIEGQIGLQAGTNVAVTLDGGSITATKMGIQATPEESSTTEIIAHAGTVTSENVSIYAKKLTLDPAEGKTITLEGKLSLTENAVLATGTKVTINGEEATGLKRAEGTILVTK